MLLFHQCFLRALKTCSTEYLDADIKFVTDVAKQQQCLQHLIDAALKRAYRIFNNNDLLQAESRTFNNILVLPFHENFLHLPSLLKRNFNTTVVFKNSSIVINLFIKDLPKSYSFIDY